MLSCHFKCKESRGLADKLIVLLKENTARDPEFDYDRSELADMNNSECKANSILKTWSARFSWGSASPWKILLFSETTEKTTTKMYMEGYLKNKEKLISHLNLNSSRFCSFITGDKTSVLTFFCNLTCLRCDVSFGFFKNRFRLPSLAQKRLVLKLPIFRGW